MSGTKKGMGLVAGAGLGAAAAAALRRRWAPKRTPSAPEEAAVGEAGRAFLDHLGEAVRIPTVSQEDRSLIDRAPFDEFHAFLARTYPRVHEALSREVVAGYSLLYTWEGADPGAPAVLLMGHLDVVGVEPGTEGAWEHPPFAGERDGEYLWGRGTTDDKGSVVALFEAVENLLAEGFRPDVTLHLAIGHDEEIGGTEGAAAIAALLAERRAHLDFVLDEGGTVITDYLPGLKAPLALVGIGEKGYLNVELTAEGNGGHSSVPPPHTAIGVLASAVQRLEAAPMPARLAGQRGFFAALAPATGGLPGLAVRNLERFGPLVERRLARVPAGNALIRTTGAVTMIQGGVKPNQLPQSARAVANFRVLPGDTVAGVLDHVRDAVGSGVTVQQLPGGFSAEPSRLADTGSASYRLLLETIGEVFPEAVAVPWVETGATDSRHYLPIAENVYRFSPFRSTPDDTGRMHGTGERLRLGDADGLVAFYRRLVERSCGAG